MTACICCTFGDYSFLISIHFQRKHTLALRSKGGSFSDTISLDDSSDADSIKSVKVVHENKQAKAKVKSATVRRTSDTATHSDSDDSITVLGEKKKYLSNSKDKISFTMKNIINSLARDYKPKKTNLINLRNLDSGDICTNKINNHTADIRMNNNDRNNNRKIGAGLAPAQRNNDPHESDVMTSGANSAGLYHL